MRIGLIDIDSKIPNLALMKLSTYHKARGAEIIFPYDGSRVDRLFASVIFTKSRRRAELLQEAWPQVEIGGTGWDLTTALPPEVESCRPDYDLCGIDYGIGFTSRGCIRRCAFCVVPEKEGHVRPVSTIAELVNPRSNFLVLLDGNFLAQPEWEARMREIHDLGLTVNFTQGLDIRLVNDDNAGWLARTKTASLTRNSSGRLHFAWDNPTIEKAVREGISTLGRAGIKPWRLTFYMLCGFDTTFAQDMYRFNVLRGLGCDPYVMVYGFGTPELLRFERWVNARIYKQCSWEEYRPNLKHRGEMRLDLEVAKWTR